MTEPGQVIAGRYRLDALLASGGMGVVWRGWDERLDRVVAVKQIRLQPGLSASDTDAARNRAMREARITARLHHPGAVPIYDVVEHDGQPCLIMQFLPSVSLQATLQMRPTLATIDVARIGSELAAALTAAHRVGIVHRDVKPGNVLIAEDGSAKLTDFGISHATGDVNLTSTGMITGTPAFLPPEVARGQSATYASDVYSLGATLYAASEGHPPVENDANPMAVLHRVASGDITPPRRSGPLAPLLLHMLDPDPAARPTMPDAWSALTSLHQRLVAAAAAPAARLTTPIPARPRPPSGEAARAQTVLTTRAIDRPQSGARSRPALLMFAGLGALAALAVGLIYFLPGTGGSPSRGGGSSVDRPTRTTARASSTGHNPASATSAQRASIATRSRSASSTSSSASSSTTTRGTSSSPTSSRPTSGGPTSSGSSSTVGSTKTQLAHAITDYYSLMPDNLSAGWPRLTPTYQNAHAGGFATYQRFWSAIRSVSTSDVVAAPPDGATATVTYHYKDGRTVVERTRYGLVNADGQWLISTSAILSSRTI